MQALPIWQTVPLFLIIIGLLVIVHEFGHFLTAKFFGVEAPEFGLGFPPRLLTFWKTSGWIQIQSKKIIVPRKFNLGEKIQIGTSVLYRTEKQNGREVIVSIDPVASESTSFVQASKVQNLDRGTIFTINAIPFGGFVRMSGEEDPTAPNAFAAKPPWQRAIILVAGVTMNLILAFLLFSVLSYWIVQVDQVTTTQIVSVGKDSPAFAAGLRSGDTIISVNGINVKNDRDAMVQQLVPNCNQQVELAVERLDPKTGVQNLTLPLTPRPFNGLACALGVTVNSATGVKVGDVAPGSLAAQSGLQPGDALVKIGDFDFAADNGNVASRSEVSQRLSEYVTGHYKVKTVALLEVIRNSQLINLHIVVPPDLPPSEATLGLDFGITPVQAMGAAVQGLATAISSVPRALSGIVSSFGRSAGDTVGPIGMGQMVAEGTPRLGLPFLVNMVAALSLSLAIFNLLPFPGLDGGRLAFVVLEVLRGGRKVDPRKEGIIHLLGFVVLLGFIIYVSYFDVVRVLSGRSLFGP